MQGQLSAARTISLETYRRDGRPVDTPVWMVEDGGYLYVRTDPMSGKAKRLRRNTHVRVAPCTFRGAVLGAWEEGEARFVEGEESRRILKLFKAKYGLMYTFVGIQRRLTGRDRLAVISIRMAPKQG